VGEQILQRPPTLSEQLVEVLDSRIREGTYPPGSLLPSESDLASEFSVSRATIRGALSALASIGRINRRQGIGTYVSKLSLISNPINKVMEFDELITSGGFIPGVSVHGVELIFSSDQEAANLGIEEGSRLLRIHKIFTADGAPLIYVNTSLPAWILANQFDAVLENPDLTEPLFAFIEKGCGRKVENMVSTFWPDTVKGCIAESVIDIFDQPLEAPVLRMNYIAYAEDDTPLFESHQAYLAGFMKFTLLRGRISKA